MADKNISDEQWKKRLSPEAYHILREKGTESPFLNKYYRHREEGIYRCAGCGEPLFASETKFASGSGWPSFFTPVNQQAVEEEKDTSHGMVRTEVHCGNCGGHLGHVFEDGPRPTGLRYCINSLSLDFEKREDHDPAQGSKAQNEKG